MAWHLFGVNPLPNSMMSKLAAIFIRDKHYSDVILGTMASQITSLTSVYSTVYSGADQKNIKALRHWLLWGEFTGDRWIPRTNCQ